MFYNSLRHSCNLFLLYSPPSLPLPPVHLCYSCSPGCGAWAALLGATPLKTSSPLPAHSFSVRGRRLPSFPPCAGTQTGLFLCRHSCWELVVAAVLPYPFQLLLPLALSCLWPLFCDVSCALWGIERKWISLKC